MLIALCMHSDGDSKNLESWNHCHFRALRTVFLWLRVNHRGHLSLCDIWTKLPRTTWSGEHRQTRCSMACSPVPGKNICLLRKCPVELRGCKSKENWYKAVMLFTLLVKRAHLWLLYKCVCQECVPSAWSAAGSSPLRGISWAFMSVLWPGITNSFFYAGGTIKIVVIYTTLQVIKRVKSQLQPEFLIS